MGEGKQVLTNAQKEAMETEYNGHIKKTEVVPRPRTPCSHCHGKGKTNGNEEVGKRTERCVPCDGTGYRRTSSVAYTTEEWEEYKQMAREEAEDWKSFKKQEHIYNEEFFDGYGLNVWNKVLKKTPDRQGCLDQQNYR